MADQLSAVKEYIERYNLEDELSNAVNMAIKQNSDDPFRVISDYLRTLAKDDDDDEEDDDDVIEEGQEIPMMKPRGRREQVIGKKVEIPEGWTPPVYEKAEADERFLVETMASNKLMKSLAPSDREQLMKAFKKVDFETGTAIIKQGDEGDLFYILMSGTCDISINNVGSVMKAEKGVAFGELALLHGAPRAATVTTETDVTAFALDELSFKSILMGKAQQDTLDYVTFLKGIDMLSSMGDDKLKELSAALKEIEYQEGKHVICEGDEGNNFYIIRSGEVKCTKVGKEDEVSRRLKRGDFFGELALLSSDKRQATVTAVMNTSVLSLDRQSFTRLLGPVSEMMSAEAQKARMG